MESSRQECWNGLPFPSPGDLSDPGSKPRPSALQAGSVPSEPPGKPKYIYIYKLFQVIFPYMLLQNIEQSSLCYTVGPYWLSILNIAVLISVSLNIVLLLQDHTI